MSIKHACDGPECAMCLIVIEPLGEVRDEVIDGERAAETVAMLRRRLVGLRSKVNAALTLLDKLECEVIASCAHDGARRAYPPNDQGHLSWYHQSGTSQRLPAMPDVLTIASCNTTAIAYHRSIGRRVERVADVEVCDACGYPVAKREQPGLPSSNQVAR